MNKRDLARDYFNKCNITYEDIEIKEIYKLIQILNRRIVEFGSCMLMINEPILNGKNKNIILDKNGKIKYAEIRVKGTYFDDREAITFNEDGWIGFCGWADRHNIVPFVMGFKEWCDYIVERKKHE